MANGRIKILFALHMLLMVYSMSGICSKKAASVSFLSLEFCLFFGGVIFLLMIYALGWQQIIKRLPLTTAFANKAVTVVWGIVWGILFFHESLTITKVIGAIFVVSGVALYANSDEEVEKNE